ncbi:CDP-glycerol glycerophosphotransferase family protein [Ornithinibacillus bavariensis]|uniref:CDP-glycerol glycerophosphotransferase family protein n=1 Tax=Ornithinibacillus bavariensis TaxID=545502 RepID=UPI000EBDBE24|nr:spore coat protein CotS [Ornithinibacillus sp.]
MSIRKFIRKVIPYDIRFLLNPLFKHLFHRSFRLRAIYTKAWETLPVNNNLIFYEAYHGRSITGNPYAIFNYVINESAFNNYHHIWAIREDTVIPQKMKNLTNVTFVLFQSAEYVKYLATAKYLINDTSFPTFFHKRKEQVYANTWHGTPLKTLGMDIKNRGLTDHKNIQRNLLFADYLVSPNQYTTEKLLLSHDIESIYGGKVLEAGYPRVDLMFNANKERIRNEVGVSLNKKIILYAPTWRGKVGNEENQSLELLKAVEQLNRLISDDYVVLLKSHYFVSKYFAEKDMEHLCVPNWVDSNELLSIVDILITDYSSIFFEYLPTGKPVIFYADDVNEYKEERGLYIQMHELPGPICQTLEEVIQQIHHIDDVQNTYRSIYDDFVKKFCSHDNGQATKRFVDTVLLQKSMENLYSTSTNKMKILMYGGGFLNNGITSAVVSLLNSMDYEKYDVTLIDHGTNKSRAKLTNMEKVNNNVHHIFRVGTWNSSLKDIYRHTLFLFTGIKKIAPIRMYEREYDRLVGLSNFDIGIDFGGYSPFWASVFAFGNFKKRCIYLHSDMKQEMYKVVNNKYPHKRNLRAIFSLYNQFDKVLSVSELTHKQNCKSLKPYLNQESKMDYVINAIDYKQIFQLKNKNNYQFELGEELIPTSNNQLTRSEDSFPFPHHDNVNFITIGRLSPEKDHRKLIDAFSLVATHNQQVRLYIVGDGVLKEELTQQVHSMSLADKVIFTGFLENPYPLLNQCDCFVLSSNYEGQAIVLLEALILGKPVIATDTPGPRSVIGTDYGLIVENSVFGLANGMQEYLSGKRMSSSQFDYQNYHATAMNMFYEKVCKMD